MKDRSQSPENPESAAFLDHSRARQYTLDDGLAGMLIEDIYQDRRGLLWIATADGGVSRFDGETFENFRPSDGLPDFAVMTIAEDAYGQLWFGTRGGGLALFDGRRFEVYTTEHGLPSNEILGMQPQADGSLLLLTGAGIGRFAGGACADCTTHIGGQPLGRVHDLVTDSGGTTWLATRTLGVISLDGRCLSPVFAEGGAYNWAWKLAEDADGLLWIATRHRKKGAVVGRYDPQSRNLDFVQVNAASEAKEIVDPGIRHVRVDDKGRLWMVRRGVLVYDGQEWHPFSARFPHADFQNTRLSYEDREGNIWIGSYGGGLVFCSSPAVVRYTEADGLPHRKVFCMAEDRRGRIWVGTERGTACLEKERIHSTKTGPVVFTMEVDRQGRLWTGDSEGNLSRGARAARVIAVRTQDDLECIPALCQDRTGRLWVTTSHGILGYIENGRFAALKERLPQGCRTLMQDSEGVLWIGTSGGSPALYYKDRAHRLHPSEFPGLEAAYGVNALCEREGMLWVGTSNGLISVDRRSGKVRRFTMDQGLPANCILSMETDRQGRLWIGTHGRGALNYDGGAFHRIHLGESSPENQVHAILCDRQERLWFGTSGGLTMYRPRAVPPGIVIRQAVEGRLLEAPEAVSFPKETGEVEIHFQGLRFRSEEEPMLYSHRLTGHGPAEEWSEFTPAKRVSYHDLPVGEYRFEVRTRDPQGILSEAARLKVRVVPATRNEDLRRAEPEQRPPVEAMSGHGPTIAGLLSQLRRVAGTDMTVLLRGETGTGKGLVARQIHDLSPRRKQAFVQVNCGSLTSTLVESELFGHEKGAFTGAGMRRIGLFEQAHGGTLFLDEIGDMPPPGQQALLNILEDGLLRRVGGRNSVPVDVRVIAATNRDLDKMIREETFRADLYYRLRTFPVLIPPLRDRREEIPVLAAHFAAEYSRQLPGPVPALSEEALGYLQEHSWPGNVRELQHLIRRAVMLCEGEILEVAHVSLPVEDEGPGGPGPVSPSDQTCEEGDEKLQILKALQATKGRIYGAKGAAKLLGMNPERLRSRMRVYGLKRQGGCPEEKTGRIRNRMRNTKPYTKNEPSGIGIQTTSLTQPGQTPPSVPLQVV